MVNKNLDWLNEKITESELGFCLDCEEWNKEMCSHLYQTTTVEDTLDLVCYTVFCKEDLKAIFSSSVKVFKQLFDKLDFTKEERIKSYVVIKKLIELKFDYTLEELEL